MGMWLSQSVVQKGRDREKQVTHTSHISCMKICIIIIIIIIIVYFPFWYKTCRLIIRNKYNWNYIVNFMYPVLSYTRNRNTLDSCK